MRGLFHIRSYGYSCLFFVVMCVFGGFTTVNVLPLLLFIFVDVPNCCHFASLFASPCQIFVFRF